MKGNAFVNWLKYICSHFTIISKAYLLLDIRVRKITIANSVDTGGGIRLDIDSSVLDDNNCIWFRQNTNVLIFRLEFQQCMSTQNVSTLLLLHRISTENVVQKSSVPYLLCLCPNISGCRNFLKRNRVGYSSCIGCMTYSVGEWYATKQNVYCWKSIFADSISPHISASDEHFMLICALQMYYYISYYYYYHACKTQVAERRLQYMRTGSIWVYSKQFILIENYHAASHPTIACNQHET